LKDCIQRKYLFERNEVFSEVEVFLLNKISQIGEEFFTIDIRISSLRNSKSH